MIEFMRASSVAVEGDVIAVCLIVVDGRVTTPTDITLTTQPNQPFVVGGGNIIIFRKVNQVVFPINRDAESKLIIVITLQCK